MMWVMTLAFLLLALLIKHNSTDFQGGMAAMMALMYAGSMAGVAVAITGDMSKAKVASHDMFQLLDTKSNIDGLEPTGRTPDDLAEVGRFEFVSVNFCYPFRPEVQVLKNL